MNTFYAFCCTCLDVISHVIISQACLKFVFFSPCWREQGWWTGDSARLSPMWPGFHSILVPRGRAPFPFWPWFSCGTVCVCPQLSYRGNDMIFWIFPIVPCHAFCMWHWPIGKDLDLSFIWGHHHLSEYMDISRPADYFIACCTVLMRPNKVETAVHGYNCWLSVWTLIMSLPR